MTSVIGLTEDEAKLRLTGLGFVVRIKEYVSRRGIENADSTRVIRQRELGNNAVELIVSHFKTRIDIKE